MMGMMMKEHGAVLVPHGQAKNFDALAIGEIRLRIEMALILVR